MTPILGSAEVHHRYPLYAVGGSHSCERALVCQAGPDTRELFVRAAREAAEYEWKWSEEEDAKRFSNASTAGMVIGTVSDEDKWAEKARSVWPKFYDTVGGKQFVDQALEA